MLDRLLYRVAFRTGAAQRALSDIEETLYTYRLEGIAAENPSVIFLFPNRGRRSF